MATVNPFHLLGDDDNDDPSQLIAAAAQQQKVPSKKPEAAPAKLAAQQPPKAAAKVPSKSVPPAQDVREARSEAVRGGRGSGRGYGRGRAGGEFNRDSANYENTLSNSGTFGRRGAPEDVDSGRPSERRVGYTGLRGPFRGGRRGGFSNGEVGDGENPRRMYDRRSGTGHGNEMKREGSGRGNWGTQTDGFEPVTEEVANESEKTLEVEKPSGEEDKVGVGKENPANEPEDKAPEDKEMTLEEYEKVLEEKRKSLQVLKMEGRKVNAKEFESMQQLANKKSSDDSFIKLGSNKDKRVAEKEERAKKSVSINEFLKPGEGEKYYNPGGRGRGRGRGSRGGYAGGSTAVSSSVEAPSISDPGQFPTLGAK